jgi:hypothetical protein
MRGQLILLLALLSACAPGGGNASANGSGEAPAATVSVAARGGGCYFRWNGAPATGEHIYQRGRALLENAILRLGGTAYLTAENIPFLRLEAAPETAWSCIAPALFAMQRAGYASVALRLAGAAPQPDQIAQFTLMSDEPGSPPSVVVEIGADGRLTWNRSVIERGALGPRARAAGPLPPNGFAVIAAPRTRFAALYETLRTVGQAGVEPTLAGCRGAADRPAPEVGTLIC